MYVFRWYVFEVVRTVWSKEGRSEQRMSHKGICGRVGGVNLYGL